MSADDTRWDPGEIDRRFDDIVAGWDSGAADDPFAGPPAAAPPAPARPTTPVDLPELTGPPVPPTEAELRRRRQEQRRAERRARRAEEVAELAEERARMAAEYGPDGDDPDDHFVPPEPPPVPRPRGRTVLGVLVVLLGIAVVVGPNVLSISPDAALILAVLLIVSGGTLLVTGLRRGRGDPGDGWDDGSRV